MAGIDIPKQKIIYKPGQPMTALHLITNGKVRVSFPNGEYFLGKGDVIGITEIRSEVHILTYESVENTNVLSYPLTSMNALNDILQSTDLARLFTISAFKQISSLLNCCETSIVGCNNVYDKFLQHTYLYNEMCRRYRMTPEDLEGYDELEAYYGEDDADYWLNSFYIGLYQAATSSDASSPFIKDPAISNGLLQKLCLDFQKTMMVLDTQYHYQLNIMQFYFKENGQDLFSYLTKIYPKTEGDENDSDSVKSAIKDMIAMVQKYPVLQTEANLSRIEAFKASTKAATATVIEEAVPEQVEVSEDLTDSIHTILSYAGMDEEFTKEFVKLVASYKNLADPSSISDATSLLRKKITQKFNELYTATAKKAVAEKELPLPVSLFLYFGFVDEELAGGNACNALIKILPSISNRAVTGVYPFFDWLRAIYNGDKEPSRNEFEEDFTDYLHKQKAAGNITAQQMTALEKDPTARITYELNNLFPLANKVTQGRISTFCPLFSEDNVMKDLQSCLVTSSLANQAVEKIRALDYTAFYRETMYYDPVTSFKENIHVECLPDVILLPNIGVRGIMWQEIEGKRRNTPARMLLSIFHLEDLTNTLIRLTGEYRWEMCKRIHGSRWNDINEHVLTSDYFDYVQFYRKNQDLTTEAKEKVKSNLQKAKNSFKEMFIRDYLQWILFEGNGSPRLNKVARGIIFTHCPFSQAACEALKSNPLFTEILQRHEVKVQQKLHRLDMLEQKFQQSNQPVPSFVATERFFISGKM